PRATATEARWQPSCAAAGLRERDAAHPSATSEDVPTAAEWPAWCSHNQERSGRRQRPPPAPRDERRFRRAIELAPEAAWSWLARFDGFPAAPPLSIGPVRCSGPSSPAAPRKLSDRWSSIRERHPVRGSFGRPEPEPRNALRES